MKKRRNKPPSAPVRFYRKHGKTIAYAVIAYLLTKWALSNTFLSQVDPMLFVQIGMAMVMQIGQVAMYFGFFFWMLGGRIRTKLYLPGDLAYTWKDYVGNRAVRERLQLIVDMLMVKTDLSRKLGGVHPTHTALVGPPGTGKSYAATVIAAEAGVPVLSVEASSLLGTFIGIGPLKVWNLFRKINKLAHVWGAAILYIDEIDAWGSGRSGAAGGGVFSLMGGNMGGQILSTFLACLSGLNEPSGLFHRLKTFLRNSLGIPYQWSPPNTLVLVATNIGLERLDPALFRSGRIGQHIEIGLPSKTDIVELCEYYLRGRKYEYGIVGVPCDDTCIPERMARIAAGCSQADIAEGFNDAKRLAYQADEERITFAHWMQAIMEARAGLKQPLPLTERDAECLAIHECGHLLAALALGQEVVVATIERYGKIGAGHVRHMAVEEHMLSTAEDIEKSLLISLSSLAAENVLGQRTPGTTADLDNVKRLLILLISQGIIGSPLMVKMPKETGGRTVGAALPIAELTEAGQEVADKYYNHRKAEAENLMGKHREGLRRLANLLKEKKIIYHEDVMACAGELFDTYQLQPFMEVSSEEG